MFPCRVRSVVPVTPMGLSTDCLQARRSFSPITGGPSHRSPAEGVGCRNKFLRTGHHKGGWVLRTGHQQRGLGAGINSFAPVTTNGVGRGIRLCVCSATLLPLRCAAGCNGHALLSTKSLHPCTVAQFYARPLRPARGSVPRGSAPTARLPATPPGSLSRPWLPPGLPSLPSPAATKTTHVQRLCSARPAPDHGHVF